MDGTTAKRDPFIRALREEAQARGLAFTVNTKRGKGSHVTVKVGERQTTLPDRDIDPVTALKARKQLGLA